MYLFFTGRIKRYFYYLNSKEGLGYISYLIITPLVNRFIKLLFIVNISFIQKDNIKKNLLKNHLRLPR